MNRCFVTCLLPECYQRKYGLSAAACNFSLNLISGGGFDRVFSILPPFVSGIIEPNCYSDSRYSLVYNSALRTKGRIACYVSLVSEQFRIFKAIPKGSSVWMYNLNILNVFLYLMLWFFKPSVQINVIVLDFTPPQSLFAQNWFYLKLINRANGNICLANSELFTCKNRVTIPGVVPNESGEEPLIERINNSFLLSGALNETIAQISLVLETFAELPQCVLHITGITDDDSLIKEYSNCCPNIIFHGKVSYDDYLSIMHDCTFQLSTRNPSSPENQCNFPSKIIEALLHNRIVVSTIMYKQLGELKYFKVDSSVEAFRSEINRIISLPKPVLCEYCNQGEIVAKTFSASVWNRSMELIENMR